MSGTSAALVSASYHSLSYGTPSCALGYYLPVRSLPALVASARAAIPTVACAPSRAPRRVLFFRRLYSSSRACTLPEGLHFPLMPSLDLSHSLSFCSRRVLPVPPVADSFLVASIPPSLVAREYAAHRASDCTDFVPPLTQPRSTYLAMEGPWNVQVSQAPHRTCGSARSVVTGHPPPRTSARIRSASFRGRPAACWTSGAVRPRCRSMRTSVQTRGR